MVWVTFLLCMVALLPTTLVSGNATDPPILLTPIPTRMPTDVITPIPTISTPIPTEEKSVFVPDPLFQEKFRPLPWCHSTFPIELNIFLYFMTCFVAGVSACGVWYNHHYEGQLTLRNRYGETMHNKILGKQRKYLVACAIGLLCSAIMVCAGLAYVWDDRNCWYVGVFFGYFILCLCTFVALSVLYGRRWAAERSRIAREKEEVERAVDTEYDKITADNALDHARGSRPEVFW